MTAPTVGRRSHMYAGVCAGVLGCTARAPPPDSSVGGSCRRSLERTLGKELAHLHEPPLTRAINCLSSFAAARGAPSSHQSPVSPHLSRRAPVRACHHQRPPAFSCRCPHTAYCYHRSLSRLNSSSSPSFCCIGKFCPRLSSTTLLHPLPKFYNFYIIAHASLHHHHH